MSNEVKKVGSAHLQLNKGFTLVELVMVLVIVGIMSAGAMSLFASRSGYSAFLGKDQFIASALETQQIALALESSASPSSLTVSASSTAWTFTVVKTGVGTVTQLTADPAGGSLVIDGATLSGSRTFNYNRSGSLVDGANHRLVFTGDNSYTVCLAASGYAYDSSGACP